MFRSDLSFTGKGLFAARRIQFTRIVVKIKYSNGLFAVKAYNMNQKLHEVVKFNTLL